MRGLLSFGAYVPYWRIQREAIAAALGTPGGRGTRSVASYDEDTTSMGVEAARAALGATLDGRSVPQPAALFFATTAPAYLDKTNATAVHAACDLDPACAAYDLAGSVRSGVGAIRAALAVPGPALAVLSDIRTGLPGGADEREGGDGAAALLFGEGEGVIAEYLGWSGSTAEFLDRWRLPGEPASRVWEERFGEQAYLPLVEQALTGLKAIGISPEEVGHLVATGVHPRALRQAVRMTGVRAEAVADDLSSVVGNTGAAHPGLLLASVLERAEPGQVVALLVLADGCDLLLFRTTERLRAFRPWVRLGELLEATRDDLPYAQFLTWRGILRREPPRRPDPEAPAAPPAFRREPWKFAFTASRCEACGTRHLPPQRVCVSCHAWDRMAPERLADVRATIATYTVDRLAFSLSPPVVVGVLDFDGGGRYQCELTDCDPAQVQIGGRVEMTFRRLYTAHNGVHNYFWKARPIRGRAGTS